MRRLLILSLLSLPYIAPIAAIAAATDPAGVWKGKLGNAEIVACFNGVQGVNANGSYYYTKYKTPIQLQKDDKKKTWNEANNTGSWTLAPSSAGMEGSWTHPKTGKTQPVTLALLMNTGDKPACASDAYNKPLEGMPALETGKTELFEGKKFRRLRLADYSSVELLESGPQMAKINKDLRAMLPAGPGDLPDYFDKRRISLGENGWAAEDETHSEPVFWSARWVTVHFYRWAAGFGSNGISLDYYTWDVRTGEKVNQWEWFGPKKASAGDVASMPAALDKFFQKGAKVDAECKEGYPGKGYFHLSIGNKGMRFWEESRGSGCEQEFDLPYGKMAPFLTPAGKAALADLLPR